MTVLLKDRRVSPASETKPGKAPKNVDYVGMLAMRFIWNAVIQCLNAMQ